MKNNKIRGFPNPETDSSFEKFRDREMFKKAIGECGEEELLTAQSRILEATELFLKTLLTD